MHHMAGGQWSINQGLHSWQHDLHGHGALVHQVWGSVSQSGIYVLTSMQAPGLLTGVAICTHICCELLHS
jgi:hypothetical protein